MQDGRRPRGRPRGQLGDGVEHLVALLEQVPGEAAVGLAAVPRAALPQRADQFDQPDGRGRHRFGQVGDPQAGQVVRDEGAVEVGPRHLEHGLVGKSQALEHDDRPGVAVHAELDVGEHQRPVALRHEERPGRARRLRCETVPVDEAGPGRDRVDPEPGPRQIQERQSRQHLQGDAVILAQQLHGALGDQRRTRDRIEDLTLRHGGLGDAGGDGRIHLLHRGGLLVDLVEGDRLTDGRRRRMAGGADEAGPYGRDGVAGRNRQQPRIPGPEPDHNDASRARPSAEGGAAQARAFAGDGRPP